MPYNTGNPIGPHGSNSPLDLSDNAENLDELVNSQNKDTHPDRLGNSRKTWKGMENEFDAAQASRDSRFNAFIASSGYTGTGAGGAVEDYATGIELTEYNQIVRDSSGEFWRLSGTTALPYTTTGAGLPEGGTLTPLGDAVLRQELGGGVRRVLDLAGLKAQPGRFDGDAARITTTRRAGDFTWLAGDQSSTLVLSTVASESVDDTTDTISATGHGLSTGDGVTVDSSVNGLTANDVYWVIKADDNNFQLSDSASNAQLGTTIDLSGTTAFSVYELLDPLEGVYIAPAGNRLGNAGTWRREILGGVVTVGMFGATGDGVTDDWPTFNEACNYPIREESGPRNYGYTVAVEEPSVHYRMASTLNIKSLIRLVGRGAMGMETSTPCLLVFDQDKGGIIINRRNTFGNGVESPSRGRADGSYVEGLSLAGSGTVGSGLWMRARASIKGLRVQGFGEHGIEIRSTSGGADNIEGNANNWIARDCRITGCGSHGFFLAGADANAGYASAIDCSNNGGWGIFDTSFLGNTFVACHTAANTDGGYKTDDSATKSVFVGCYSEGNQPDSEFARNTIVIGGQISGSSGGVVLDRTFFSGLDTLETATAITASQGQEAGVAVGAMSVWHRGSLTGGRGASVAFEVGRVDNPERRYVSNVFGRASNNSDTDLGQAGFQFYEPSSGSWVDGVSVDGNAKNIKPGSDNEYNNGTADLRWGQVYAANGTINTSDEREKQKIRKLSDAEHRVAIVLKSLVRAFKWNHAVQKKGVDGARWHFGVIAQEVVYAFESEGLNPDDYGLLCYDAWDDQPEERDEQGNMVTPYRPSGDRYGVRYDELMAFIISEI